MSDINAVQVRTGGSMRETCQAFLSACRAVARKNNEWTDRACAVLEHGGDWYEIRDYNDNIVWHGQAHCKYCARAEAVLKGGKHEA